MRKLLGGVPGILIALIALAGCATIPQVANGAPNYLEKGMVSARTKGEEFYMAIGQVDLYEYGFWGNLKPSGKTVDIAVVIQADQDTGQVLRIATLQPRDAATAGDPSGYRNGAGVANGSPYALGDLRGGISVTDMQPYPRWLDAIEAMRKAIGDLGAYTAYASEDRRYLVAVVREPTFGMGMGMSFGWGWGWPAYGHHRR
jgi:hypothetical protein